MLRKSKVKEFVHVLESVNIICMYELSHKLCKSFFFFAKNLKNNDAMEHLSYSHGARSSISRWILVLKKKKKN